MPFCNLTIQITEIIHERFIPIILKKKKLDVNKLKSANPAIKISTDGPVGHVEQLDSSTLTQEFDDGFAVVDPDSLRSFQSHNNTLPVEESDLETSFRNLSTEADEELECGSGYLEEAPRVSDLDVSLLDEEIKTCHHSDDEMLEDDDLATKSSSVWINCLNVNF